MCESQNYCNTRPTNKGPTSTPSAFAGAAAALLAKSRAFRARAAPWFVG